MIWRWLADGLVVVHLLFIAFVVAGGLLVLRNRRVAFWHLPAVAWAAFTEFTGTICPLTPVENMLRHRAGDVGYAGGFVEHYLLPVIYPPGLTPAVQLTLGTGVLVLNALVYVLAWWRWRQHAE